MKNYTSYTPTPDSRAPKIAKPAKPSRSSKPSKSSPKPLRREKHNHPRDAYQKPKSLTFPIMCVIMLVWGLIVLGLATLQAVSGSAGKGGSNDKNPTSSATEAENLLSNRFFDENGLARAENREVITLAAEVVRLIEERGFRVGEVVVPKGYLREFDLVMEAKTEEGTVNEKGVRLRCSTTRLASATAADAIHVYDLWLDGNLQATEYIDIRTPRRAFYK